MKHTNTLGKMQFLMLKLGEIHSIHHTLKVMKLSLKVPNFKIMYHDTHFQEFQSY